MKNPQKPGQPLEAVSVQGQLYKDRVVFADGSLITFNFDMQAYLCSDVAFCEYDPASRLVTPIPWNPPAGNPAMNPATLAAADAKKSWLSEGARHLKDAGREIYESIKSGKISEALAAGWKDVGQKWVETTVQGAMPTETYQVHFTTVAPFFHMVGVSGESGIPGSTINSMEDSGAGVNLISPEDARRIGAKPGRNVVIEGITPGVSETAKMTKVYVTLAPGVTKDFEAAIYPPLRKKISTGFLLGRPIIDYARKNGVEGM